MEHTHYKQEINITDALMTRINELIGHYPEDKIKSALLPVLHEVQDAHDNWLSIELQDKVAEIYHPVEGGNGELGFYLVTDGSRTPYRLHFRRPCFIYYQAYPEMIKGALLSDAIVILSSLNVIAGELDA